MEQSGEKITKESSREHTRHRVAEAFLDAPTENVLRERLRAYHIDLFIRRNDTGRITGVTFIDHENRCVLNGSRLGKEYSANVLNEQFGQFSANEVNTKQKISVTTIEEQLVSKSTKENDKKPPVQKKKRQYGRQM